LGATGFDDFDRFLAAVEVVTVAAPAMAHGPLALGCLRAGRHVYVEKPLAVTLAEARVLIEEAEVRGLVLAAGHQERMVFAAMGLFDLPEAPRRIESVRRGLPNPRNRDVSCAPDLMIHDLDLAAALARSPAVHVEAKGQFDELAAEVGFESGMTARFEASRIAPARERTMRLEFASGVVEVDFLAPSFRNTTAFALDPGFAASVDGKDPLGRCVAGFLAAVRGEAARPPATGQDGLEALKLSVAVERAAGLL
jgi:predicted dehydrogenase